MDVMVCIECYNGEDSVQHSASMITDLALVQALMIIHNEETALKRFFEVGGVIHGHKDELRSKYGHLLGDD